MDPAPVQQPRKQPTIRDVARRAEVGVGTVSRVLNGSPKVSDDARRRVRETIAALGYRRSPTARSLSTGRTQTIGVVAPYFTTGSVSERLRGVVDQLREHGDYDLMLFDVETVAQRADAFRDFARSDRVDGLLIISLCPSDEEIERLRRERLAVVLVDIGHPAFPHVVIDDVLGGELATDHLLARGHRRIAFIGDAPHPFGFTSSEQRRLGMCRALARAGIEPSPELDRRGRPGRDDARVSAVGLLRMDVPPTAVFAASDVQAMGVLEAADLLSIDVPGELAVIGFDDLEVSAALGLTTVRQPLRETGARGAELLLGAITGSARRPLEVLAPLTVVQRRTT